jgi:hypothetical protein
MRLDEFYSPEQDRSVKYHQDDTRKSRLTLEILNRLRKLRDIERAEEATYAEFAKKIYGVPAEGDDAGLI